MCFQFLQSVVHGVQWYVFCFGYTDKMPIIIIFDPSGSCVIFARSIFIIFCLHIKKWWYLYSYTATYIPIAFYQTNVTHHIQIMYFVSFLEISYELTETFVNYPIKRYFIPSRWNPKRHFLFLTVMMLLYM